MSWNRGRTPKIAVHDVIKVMNLIFKFELPYSHYNAYYPFSAIERAVVNFKMSRFALRKRSDSSQAMFLKSVFPRMHLFQLFYRRKLCLNWPKHIRFCNDAGRSL